MNLAGIEVIELCICLFQRLGFLTVLIPETMMQPDFKRVRAKCLTRFFVHSSSDNLAMCARVERTLNQKSTRSRFANSDFGNVLQVLFNLLNNLANRFMTFNSDLEYQGNKFAD